jgi:hypothetical protein
MHTEDNGLREARRRGHKRGAERGLPAGDASGVPAKQATLRLPPRLLDLDAAAGYLGVSPWTVRDLEAAGTLKRVTIPVGAKDLRKLLFDRADLDALIERWKAS